MPLGIATRASVPQSSSGLFAALLLMQALMQLESQREQEAEKAAKKHEEVAEAHLRLKRVDKNLKQLITNQVCCYPLN